MCKIIIFGGTAEGRKLAWYCAGHEIAAAVCVVSEYGAGLLPESPCITIWEGEKDREDIEALLVREKPKMVLDATHPYAAAATENIKEACAGQKITYIRIVRDSQAQGAEGDVRWVCSAKEAADYLSSTEGNILLTTGTKELGIFAGIRDFEKRVYARVLPDEKAVRLCRDMGLAGSHIMAMQGPFSAEMNRAMVSVTKAKYLVTKESGTAGGFLQKLEAAEAMKIQAVVIGRPPESEGISLEEAMKLISPYGRMFRQRIFLVGIGMGGEGQLTGEAVSCLERAQAVIGAGSMVERVDKWCRGKETFLSYKPEEIVPWLEEHAYIEEAAIVYSGDTGFYSGAGAMAKRLEQEGQRYEVVMVPGISTVSFLCGKLKTSWEDVYLASLHGREANVEDMLRRHRRVFLLMEGTKSVDRLLERLKREGYGKVRMSGGMSLSRAGERIVTGTIEELKDMFEEENGFPEGPWAVLLEQGERDER